MKPIEKEEAIRLVKKTPIVYRYLPEQLQRDREVAIAFIKSNAGYISAYFAALLEAKQRDAEEGSYTASSLIRANHADLFLNGIISDLPEVLNTFTGDAEVLSLLGSTGMSAPITFTDRNYHEKVLSKAIGKGHALVDPLFAYWYARLPRDKKTDEHIRVKYELTVDDPIFLVAAFKCLEVIDAGAGDPDAAHMALLMKCNAFRAEAAHGEEEDAAIGYDPFFFDHQKQAARLFKTFSVQKQNELAGGYYFLASLMKPTDLDPALAQIIAKECPLARRLLPGEYTLRYDLHRDPAHRDCTKCAKCFIRHMLLF